MRVLAIAHNTFRESVRDKVLYVLLLFAALSILGAKALGWISVGQDIKIVKDISLASISLFGVLVAIFVGTSLVYKEMDKRTLYTIISQPLHRYEFVLGKYVGLAAVLALVTAVMTLSSACYVLVLGGSLEAVYFLAAFLIFMKLLLVTAFALLLSSLSSPILGAIIVFCLYLFGHATGVFKDLPPQFEGTFAKQMLEVAYYVIPNLSNFDLRSEAANGVAVNPLFVVWVLIYGVSYSAVFLLLAASAFQEKDL
ncbi:MAG: ABC transporter permease subunit [Candidatus Hydrogenedentes bacterium]|nr:ABC transporter permease subunit [Candidatus Hydrogenedentota bacterium]